MKNGLLSNKILKLLSSICLTGTFDLSKYKNFKQFEQSQSKPVKLKFFKLAVSLNSLWTKVFKSSS